MISLYLQFCGSGIQAAWLVTLVILLFGVVPMEVRQSSCQPDTFAWLLSGALTLLAGSSGIQEEWKPQDLL